MITIIEAHIREVMPLVGARAATYVGPLNDAMQAFDIALEPLRIAAFLAEIAWESGELRYTHELASGEAYEGRKDLGDTQPGDGSKFKGRGPIEITGRSNYQKCSQALFGDDRLLDHPELLEEPEWGCMASGWFWQTHGLNELADQRNFVEITHRINGGYSHEPEREHYYKRALAALGVQT